MGKNGNKLKVDRKENNIKLKCVMNNIMIAEELKLSKEEENRFKDIFNPKILADRLFYSSV